MDRPYSGTSTRKLYSPVLRAGAVITIAVALDDVAVHGLLVPSISNCRSTITFVYTREEERVIERDI